MAREFLDDESNMAEIISHMPPAEQAIYKAYGHLHVAASFIDRVFVVYKPTGLNAAGRHRAPEILTTVRVVDFGMDTRNGCYARLIDEQYGTEMRIGYVPQKVFGFPVYVSVPPRCMLRWDARNVDEKVIRSFSFALLIKSRNRADFYSKGVTYMETPVEFKRLYPASVGQWVF